MVAHSKPMGLVSMLFAALLFLQATAALSHGHQHAHRSEKEVLIERATQELHERAGYQAITGVKGTVAPRLEIRDLKKDIDAWNLYLLGMERFKAKPHSDVLSYYQIAGIHGRPFKTWDNYAPILNSAGFCPHSCVLFGTWHRPYLALYEQAWYQNVLEVIATFPSVTQPRLKKIAATLRMPYWDWAKNPNGESNVPSAIRDPYVSVYKPSGKVSIPNPLFSFTYGSTLPAEIGGAPWNNWPVTLRRPIANPTRSNNDEVSSKMQSLRISLRDRVFGLFMAGQSFGYMSTEAIGVRTAQNGNNPDSIESIHDAVHTTIGGDSQGTMSYLDYAAFDPVFWLHHCNIDRLLAMYQVVSPNTYVAIGPVNHPMAQWNQGEVKNGATPLKPFRKNSKGDFFNSDDVRNTRVLGYTYPETNGNPSSNYMRSIVTNLYGPKSGGKKRSVSGQYEGRPYQEGDYNTVFSVQANKYAIEGSYEIHCFVGDKKNSTQPSSPYGNSTATATASASYSTGTASPYSNSTGTDYTSDPNYVGSYGVLGGTHTGQTVVTEGCIPLTTSLQGKCASGHLKSLHPDDVEPYLADNLYYKVIGPGGVEINPDDLPDFHVYVKSSPITPAKSDDEFPQLGDYTVLPKCTENLPAGKPFTYTPTPLDYIVPGDSTYNYTPSESSPTYSNPATPVGSSYPSGTYGAFPYPNAPENENGYCVNEQVIHYVDPAGNFLYETKGY